MTGPPRRRIAATLVSALLALALPAAAARGATYFVAPNGSDAAPGSSSAPWQTLQHAADRVVAGDTVIVRAGSYAGFVLGWDFPQNGAPGNPITFHAEPGAAVVSRNAKTADGINLEGASWIVLDGFEVNGVPRAGIRSVTNTGVVIRNNRCDANGVWGILTGFSDNIVIENNVTSRSGTQHGIYVSNSCVNPVVRGNVVWGNHGNGIHMNGDVSQGGNGIITGALVERNVVYENGAGGGSGINCDGVQSSVFRNNLLYANHASGISLYRIDAADGARNNLVVNNTIVMASDGRWAINIKDGSIGNTVVNNILYNNHPFRGSINIVADSLPGFTSNFNAVMQRFSTDDGDTVLTLAQWRAATGQDASSIVATPAILFADVAAANYRLSAASPAIDAGTAGGAPSTDLDGNHRPIGAAPDMGAYEAGGCRTCVAGDFNGDRKPDLLWRHGGTGADAVWLMNGTAFGSVAGLLAVPDAGWRLAATADSDGDGQTDLLWRHSTAGLTGMWLMNGTALVSPVALPGPSDTGWAIAGFADFDGDGKPDILWRHSSGAIGIWRMSGGSVVSVVSLSPVDPGWKIAGTGDFNGDGKPDLVFRHDSGANGVWYMNGMAFSSAAPLPPADPSWTLGAIADFNGDGRPDIVWRHSSGVNAIWLMNGTGVSSVVSLPIVTDSAWKIVGPR